MTQEQIQEIRYLVGEAWKGAYNPTTVYGNANVVQDTEGLSVYRSLKPGNSGHPLTDQQWWFKIIDMSSIKALYDQMVEGNNTMAENELERVAAEQSRVSAEQSRVNAENARIYNENQRINDETTRVRAEQDRVTQENHRISQEQGRVGAEQQRVVKEQQRVNQEASRVAAETQRQLNENDRQAVFAEDHAVAVADHQQAEQDHTRAESDHETAVSDHGQTTGLVERADADHVQAGQDHTRAESDHATAASDHTQAEQYHTTAAADHEQATTDHTRAESDHTRAESDHAAVEVYVDSLGAFDISAYHATGGVLAKYADLTAALGTNGANIPDALRKGGMSVKFVLSSDNNYIQARLMANAFTTDITKWQVVDDEPTAGSNNLVKSGGTKAAILEEIANALALDDTNADFDTDGYIDMDNGKIISYQYAKATSKYYPIIDNYYHYIYSGDKNYSVAPVAYYDKDKNFILCTYPSGAASYDKQEINNVLSIPSNAVYVRFSALLSGAIGNNYSVDIQTEYVKKGDIVNNLTTNAGDKPLSAAMGVQLKTEINQSENEIIKNYNDLLSVFDDVNVEFDAEGYIDIDSGEITSYANARATSNFYPIIGNCFHYIYSGTKNYSVVPVAYYDKDKHYIEMPYPSGKVSYDKQDISSILPIPSNAAYVRFSSLYIGSYSVEVKTEYLKANNLKMWVGKKWACLGDSLTENNIRTTKHYFDYVRDLTGISIANCGSGGTGYANRQYGEEAAFYQRVNSIPTDSDVITIFGSFNDIGTKKADGITPLPLGNIDDTDPSESICGAINLTITNIQNRIPSCRLGVVTPTPWSSCKPTVNGNSVCELYVNAIIDICKLRSIPYLDLFRCSNLRPWDVSFRNIAYSKDGTYSAATSETQGAIQVTASNIDAVHLCGLPNAQIGDWVLPSLGGVHPDELGHKIIAPRFMTFIESLFI